MFRRAESLLPSLRSDPTTWGMLACHAPPGDGDPADPNQCLREEVCAALQYDRRPGDEALARFLCDQEAACIECIGGTTDGYHLAAFLVARFKRVEDVWRLARLKVANFDTACAFDREYLLSAGVEATLAYVRASDDARRERVLREVLDPSGAPLFDQKWLDEWWAGKEREFPASLAEEHPLTVATLAATFGAPVEALDWLERWVAAARAGQLPNGRTAVTDRRWALDVVAAVLRAPELAHGPARVEALAAEVRSL